MYTQTLGRSRRFHANIATVFEIDESETPDGGSQPFIAMELVEGETLTDLVASGPLALKDVIRIGTQVAGGL